MDKKEETGVAKVKSLMETDVMTEKFRYINSKIPILEKSSLELKVETEESLAIAKNNASEAHTFLKELDNTRKILKAPYAETVKVIDTYCKKIEENLARIKLRFTSQVANYKILQEAQAKIERDKKMLELQQLEAEKTEESGKITRIEAQLVARIFGGTYKNKDGQPKTVSGCVRSTECDELLTWINANVPAVSSFKHLGVLYEDTIISIRSRLADHKANILDLETKDGLIAQQGALKRINESRVEASNEIIMNAKTAEKIIQKEVIRETRNAERVIEDAGKGLRETITFRIIDETLVPRDMLSIDESKITKYINANKEKIKESLTKNEESVPGIRFAVEDKFITR